MFISLYVVLRAGRGQFGNWKGFLLPISLYVVLRADRAQFGILVMFLMFISLYVVLRAGRGQFGNLEGVSIAYFTLCSTQSRLRAIWDFGRSF